MKFNEIERWDFDDSGVAFGNDKCQGKEGSN